MTRITPVNWKKLEQFFLSQGFKFARQTGSHRAYIKKGTARPVIIPAYNEVPVSIVRNNLKTAGISREEYLNFLGDK